MFELRGVSKHYDSTVALHPTDLGVSPRQTTVLIGPSGCGKSTLLRLMVGLIEPDSGSVHFAGTPVRASNIQKIRERIGYVIQEGGLFPHLTASANVTLMARHLCWDPPGIAKRLDELTELTQFPRQGLQRYPAQLSGGQRQRVSLMRALMLDPDVLLLDEPLGALDPMIRAELQEQIKEIFQTLAKTVVMVTHDLGEAGFFGQTIVLLKQGHIVQQGTVTQMTRAPADEFVTRFIKAQRPLKALQEKLE